MSRITLRELVDNGARHARECLLARGNPALTSIYHVVLPGDATDAVIPCAWHDDREKTIVVSAIKVACRQFEATAIMYLGEAWMLSLPSGTDPNDPALPRPSQSPERIEVVQIMATDGRETIGRTLEMKRDAGGRLTDLVVKPWLGGLTSGFLIDGFIDVRPN